jgi:hypothetical protein
MSIIQNITEKDIADFMTRFPQAFDFLADRACRNELQELKEELQRDGVEPGRFAWIVKRIEDLEWRMIVASDQESAAGPQAETNREYNEQVFNPIEAGIDPLTAEGGMDASPE